MKPSTLVVLWGGMLGLASLFSAGQPAVAQVPDMGRPEVTASEVVDRESLKAFVQGAARAYLEAARTLSYDQVAEIFRVEGGHWKSGSIYIFIGTKEGIIFFHGANPSLEGRNLYDHEDLNGVKYVQDLIAAAEAGGGYVEYLFDDPLVEGDEETGSPKVDYAQTLSSPDFQGGRPFVIVSGFFRGSPLFIPVVLSTAGLNQSFFTSEMTLTNRGSHQARLRYSYTAHRGGGSGTASDVLAPGQQRIEPDAITYLKNLGVPIPDSGNRVGTLSVEVFDSREAGVVVRTTTAVPGGRAGLAYPGIPEDAGFEEAVYLCGLRQNAWDRSNVAFQNMGTPEEGPITLRATVFSGDPTDSIPRPMKDVTLEPGGFHQYSGVLGRVANGYVKVERVEGTAPFHAYGVINDQANSDGSFVSAVAASSMMESMGQILPVIVERAGFASELMVTNFSETDRTLNLIFVADGVETPDHTARFPLRIEAGGQLMIRNVIDEWRRLGVRGIGPANGGLAGPLFATADDGDMSGIVIGARTGMPGGGGQYSVFYNAVPYGAAFTESAWIDALQQNRENRSNLALVNTGEVNDGDSVFNLDIYDGETGMLVNTVTGITVAARHWRQIDGILDKYAPGTVQGYARISKISGDNPFLAYGIVNDGGAPGERSGDGAYLPARQ